MLNLSKMSAILLLSILSSTVSWADSRKPMSIKSAVQLLVTRANYLSRDQKVIAYKKIVNHLTHNGQYTSDTLINLDVIVTEIQQPDSYIYKALQLNASRSNMVSDNLDSEQTASGDDITT